MFEVSKCVVWILVLPSPKKDSEAFYEWIHTIYWRNSLQMALWDLAFADHLHAQKHNTLQEVEYP